MGKRKKEASRKEREGGTGDGLANVKTKGENFYRSAKKARLLNMFNEGKPQRNASGKITKSASYQSRDAPAARVEPNRKWFTNSRVISQDALDSFRTAMAERASNPYQVLLKSNKLPMSLIRDGQGKNGLKEHQAKIAVGSAPFADTFGPKAQRNRVKLGVASLDDLASESVKLQDDYLVKLEEELALRTFQTGGAGTDIDDDIRKTAVEPIFSKGQSKRIWNELYKVIDSSDVVIHVLDARDPLGTRCRSVEKYIKEEAPHKHLVFVMNKCDLVPTSVAARWVRILSKDYPTKAFHASITNSFGKGSLIDLLRQFSNLHSERKQISVGFIGYPNTGKSSIINTLRKKKVCTVAPIPGETKVWQYITLMKRIYLIDCPGVVPPNATNTDEDNLLRGAFRVENVDHPAQYIPAVLRKTKQKHIERTYSVECNGNSEDFLERLARKSGRLLKGGEPDLEGVAKMVINDFLRGKIPWYTPPPHDGSLVGDEVVEGRTGRLGEMSKRHRPEATETTSLAGRDDTTTGYTSASEHETEAMPSDNESAGGVRLEAASGSEEDKDFEGFESE